MTYIMFIVTLFILPLCVHSASADDQQPHTFKQYFALWKTCVGQNRLEDALDVLKNIPLDQTYEYCDYLDYLWASGSTYRKLNCSDIAQQFFTKIINSKPVDNYHYWWLVGNAFKALDDKTQAVSCWKKALTFTDPQQHSKEITTLYCNIGHVASINKQYQDAIDALKRAIALNPQSVSAYDCLGTAYRKIGNFTEALVCYKKALELDPQWINSINNIGICYYKHKKIKQAVQQFKKTIMIDPLHYEAHFRLGKHYALKKKKKRALQHLKSASLLLKEGMVIQKYKIQKLIEVAEKL